MSAPWCEESLESSPDLPRLVASARGFLPPQLAAAVALLRVPTARFRQRLVLQQWRSAAAKSTRHAASR